MIPHEWNDRNWCLRCDCFKFCDAGERTCIADESTKPRIIRAADDYARIAERQAEIRADEPDVKDEPSEFMYWGGGGE